MKHSNFSTGRCFVLLLSPMLVALHDGDEDQIRKEITQHFLERSTSGTELTKFMASNGALESWV